MYIMLCTLNLQGPYPPAEEVEFGARHEQEAGKARGL